MVRELEGRRGAESESRCRGIAARLSAHQECLQGECQSVVTLPMLDGSLIGLQKGIESYIQAV
jgi:hypothetical protein